MSFKPTDSKTLGRFMGDATPTAAQIEMTRLMAASALVLKLERICSRGLLSHEEEMESRQIIVDAAKAFRFDTIAERPVSTVIKFLGDDYERTIETVSREMGQ